MAATFWSQIPRGLFETSRLRVSNHVLVDNLDRYTSWKGPNQVRRQPPTASQCWANMTIWLEVCVRFEKSKSAIDNLIADCEGSQWDTSFAHVLMCRGWTIRPVREMEPQNHDRLQIIKILDMWRDLLIAVSTTPWLIFVGKGNVDTYQTTSWLFISGGLVCITAH